MWIDRQEEIPVLMGRTCIKPSGSGRYSAVYGFDFSNEGVIFANPLDSLTYHASNKAFEFPLP